MERSIESTTDFEKFFNISVENARAKTTTDARPFSKAILQQMSDGVHLTTKEGRVMDDPVWPEFPVLMGSGMFLHGSEVWTIDGERHTDWIQGELIIMINNWICQRINDEVWLSYVYNNTGKYEQGDNMRIEEFGYADLTRAIVKTSQGWHKVIYIDGFYHFEEFSLFATTTKELRVMEAHGAAPELIRDIKISLGEPNPVLGRRMGLPELYAKMTAEYFGVVNGCLLGKSVDIVGTTVGADLQVVFGVNNCIGTRKDFFAK